MREQNKDKFYDRLVPTLDGDGWMRYSTSDKLDRLLAHFFTTDAAQSSLYYGQIGSYQSISANNAGDILAFREQLEGYLSRYLNKYLDKAEVRVYTTDTNGVPKDLHDLDSAAIGIKLEIEYIENNNFLQFKKDLYYSDKGVFYYVLDKFNTGI